MPTVAEQLREAREAKKLTVQQVADATKIRTDHVRALEEGNFNIFPAPIYIRGSVKNYATLLKLDAPKILAELEAELKGTEKFSEPPPFTAPVSRPLDQVMFLLAKLNLKWLLAAGAILVVIIFIWIVSAVLRHHHGGRNPPAGAPPAVYQPANSGDTLPLPNK